MEYISAEMKTTPIASRVFGAQTVVARGTGWSFCADAVSED